MTDINFDQRFCFRLGHSATETFAKLHQAYRDNVQSRAQVFWWFKAFSVGRSSIEDEPRSGRPSTSRNNENVDRIRDLVRSDCRLTVRMIGETLNLNRNVIHQIFTNELVMRKICAKIVPQNLSQQQKDIRKERCVDFLESIENDPHFLERVITGDESWVFEYDPETKRQSMSGNTATSPRPKKARMSKSKIKSIVICFLDSQGIVHKEFVPQGQTVYQHFTERSLNNFEKGSCVWYQTSKTHGCCITTMLHATLQFQWTPFWPVKTFLGLLRPLIRLIWVLVTSSFSQDWKITSKGVILGQWNTFKCLWLTSWRLFQDLSSCTAKRSGRDVSSGVWLPKGVILKETMLICNFIGIKNLYKIGLITLVTHRIYFRLIFTVQFRDWQMSHSSKFGVSLKLYIRVACHKFTFSVCTR